MNWSDAAEVGELSEWKCTHHADSCGVCLCLCLLFHRLYVQSGGVSWWKVGSTYGKLSTGSCFWETRKKKKKKNPESRKSSVSDCDGLDFQKSHSGCILTWILDRMKNRQRFNSLCVKSSNWKPLYTTLSSSPLARRLRHSGHRPRSWRSTFLKTLPLSPPDHSDRYFKKFSKGVLDCSWRLNLQEGSQVALPLSLM